MASVWTGFTRRHLRALWPGNENFAQWRWKCWFPCVRHISSTLIIAGICLRCLLSAANAAPCPLIYRGSLRKPAAHRFFRLVENEIRQGETSLDQLLPQNGDIKALRVDKGVFHTRHYHRPTQPSRLLNTFQLFNFLRALCRDSSVVFSYNHYASCSLFNIDRGAIHHRDFC